MTLRTSRPARTLIALSLAAIPLAGPLGCTTKKFDSIRLDAPALAETAVAGPGIDIANVRGNITLRVIERAQGISVTPTVRLDKDGPEHFDLDLVASSIDVSAEIQDRGGLPALVIATTSTRDAGEFFVDLDITVPSAEGLRIRSGGGVIRVLDIAGAVDIDNVRGPIEVRTVHPLTQPVSITTGAGDIILSVPPQTTGRITMQAFDGQCYLESRSKSAIVTETYSKGTNLTSVINRGENPINLTTTDGSVRMWVLDEPTARIGLGMFVSTD